MSVFVVCACGVDGCVNFFERVGGFSLTLCGCVGFLVFYLVYSFFNVPD